LPVRQISTSCQLSIPAEYPEHEENCMKFFQYLIFSVLLMVLPGKQISADPEDPDLAGIESSVIFFYYEQLQDVAPFYGEVLGLPLSMDEGWVKIFRITATSSVGLVQQGRGFHEVSADKPAMLSMVVDNVDAWYERLQSAGVRILKPLPAADTDTAAGAAPVRGFIAEDPGGYTIEFFTWQRDLGSE
jgi:catechol 2,3-dioxygenase-like lactoylglutathione lyase family enzyme